MSSAHSSTPPTARSSRLRDRPLVWGLALLGVLALVGLSQMHFAVSGVGTPGLGEVNLLLFALLAFAAGMLSFLSPCCLPVLSAYFAITFQASRERIVLMTVAFFLGLATTMVVLGASATVLSQLLFQHLRLLTVVGGVLVMGFGVLSFLGKGFSGMRLHHRPNASVAGSYLYGATFGLGWTACVGPILGALLTMLATQGVAVVQAALLAFVYALGLGMPLILTATFFSRLGPDSRVWQLLRGRGFTVTLGSHTLYLHTTSMISGVLLIVMGLLLATGYLTTLSQWSVQTPVTQWMLSLEDALRALVLGS